MKSDYAQSHRLANLFFSNGIAYEFNDKPHLYHPNPTCGITQLIYFFLLFFNQWAALFGSTGTFDLWPTVFETQFSPDEQQDINHMDIKVI